MPIANFSSGLDGLSRQSIGVNITPDDIAWLWMVMTKTFGYKFLNCFGDSDEGVWLQGLQDLTRQQLAYGFQKMLRTITDDERKKQASWPPNMKEFRMYCEQQVADLGLPNVHRAFAEMEKNQLLKNPCWSHPLVCLAAEKMEGLYAAHRGILFEYFERIYENLIKQFVSGALSSLPKCRLTRSAKKLIASK